MPRPGALLPRLAAPVALLLVAAAFLPGLGGEFLWDDEQLIVRNAHVQAPTLDMLRRPFWDVSTGRDHVDTGYYRPVVSLAYVGEFALFGARPLGYKACNLLLHLACAALAIGWVRRRTGAAEPAATFAAAIAVGVLFVHPTRVESVTWISGCTDLWMTFFALAGVTLWQRGGRWRLGAALALVLSMLSKEAGAVVPALLVCDAALLAPARERRREVQHALGLALGCGAAFALRLVAFPPAVRGGAGAVAAAAALGRYVQSAVWPVRPSFLLGAHDLAAHPAVYAWIGVACVIGLGALGASALRAPRLRGVLADVLWCALPLLPVLGLVAAPVAFGERFLYLPLLGLAALFARGLLAARARAVRVACLAGAAGGFFALGSLSLLHGRALSDDGRLWMHELEEQPDEPLALENLAKIRLNQGRYPEVVALAHRGYAMAAEPAARLDFLLLAARSLLFGTRDEDRGSLEALRGFYDALSQRTGATLAVRGFQATEPDSPALRAAVHARALDVGIPRAMTYRRTGQLAEAERQVRALLALFPRQAALFDELARVLLAQGRRAEARRAAEAGLQLSPATPSLLELFEASR